MAFGIETFFEQKREIAQLRKDRARYFDLTLELEERLRQMTAKYARLTQAAEDIVKAKV